MDQGQEGMPLSLCQGVEVGAADESPQRLKSQMRTGESQGMLGEHRAQRGWVPGTAQPASTPVLLGEGAYLPHNSYKYHIIYMTCFQIDALIV